MIEPLQLEAIKKNPRNARVHSARQIAKLAGSIAAFGFVVPVLIDEHGVLLCGHARAAAAEQIGIAAVPAIRIRHLSEAQKRAFVIADNRLAELASWDEQILKEELNFLDEVSVDFDFSVIGFETAEIDLRLDIPTSANGKEDKLPEAPLSSPPVTEPGDLWVLERHRLHCGNALELPSYETLLAGERAQMAIADPPYNVPIQGHVGGLGAVKHREFAMASGEMTSDQFAAFLTTAMQNMRAHSLDGSLHFVFMDWRHTEEIIGAGKRAYTELKNLCVWNKSNAGMGSLYRSKHELVFVFKNGTASHINNVELGANGRYRTNVWDYPGVNSFGRERDALLALHPTVKPVALIADAIKDCTKRGDLILDSFAGSGTTVNEEEAPTVLQIFRRYIELRSVRALQADLDAAGIRSKRRTLADGTQYGGQKLSRGALYLMLQNRIYRGEITHKGNAYPGEHPAIVDKTLWDEVQGALAENRVDRASGSYAKQPSLLARLAFDETGERLTPSHAVKKGTRYRYYVSRSLIAGTAKDRPKGRRIPAANLESLVITRLHTFLSDQGAILDAISDEHADGAGQKRLIARGRQIAEELGTLPPDQIRAMLIALLSRVDISPDRVEITVRRGRLVELLCAQPFEATTQGGKSDKESEEMLTLTVRARLQRVGREMRMLVENAGDQTMADPGLLRIVARGHDIQERLMQNNDLTVHIIAHQERVSANYVYRLLRLPTLAPDIITAIINGKNPPQLTAKKLMRLTPQIPVDWAEQRKLLGFQ